MLGTTNEIVVCGTNCIFLYAAAADFGSMSK